MSISRSTLQQVTCSVELFPHHNVPRQIPPFSPITRRQQVETFHRISERRRPQLEARLTLQTHPR